jgi:hypothetical protein
MGLRGVLALAILAALFGAPLTASAASNQLHSPAAGPTSGTVTTLSWPVTFRAVATHGNRPTPAGPTLAVASAPGASGPTSAAAALVALGALLVGSVLVRRRRREATDVDLMATAAETEALLERRALRRARMVLDEPMDPIVASLGLDEPETVARGIRRRRARRAGDEDA